MKWSFAKVEEDESEDVTTFWLITYSDMTTLLLTFFLLIFSFTQMNEGEAGKLMRTLNTLARGGKLKPEVAVDLEKTAAEIASLVTSDQADEKAYVEASESEVTVVLPSGVTFPSGEAALTDTARTALTAVAQKLAALPGNVRVEGHTDDVPMRGARFPSNWHLSAARAQSVARLFIDAGMDPRHIQIIGFGDTRPLVPNDSAENRRKNRRTEIKLLRGQAK